jgi:hypothetical protein
MAKRPTIEYIDESLARWKTRLKRAVTTIDKLEKQKKRLMKKSPMAIAETLAEPVLVNPKTELPKAEPAPADLGIPDFLRRQSQPDPVAEQIREEQAATKKAKARGRIEKMKAKKAGELKKMPLSGKAALDHIRNG